MLRASVRGEGRWAIRRIEAPRRQQQRRSAVDQRSLSVQADGAEIPKTWKLEAIIGERIHHAELRCDTPGGSPISIRYDAFRMSGSGRGRSHLQRTHIAASENLVQVVGVLLSGAVGRTTRHGDILD